MPITLIWTRLTDLITHGNAPYTAALKCFISKEKAWCGSYIPLLGSIQKWVL